MSGTVPQTPAVQILPSAIKSPLAIGQQGFFSVIGRAIGAELYKLRKRLMPKILIPIGLFLVIAGFAIMLLPALIISSAPSTTFLPPPCSVVHSVSPTQTCLNGKPTQADLAQAAQTKANEVQSVAASLHLPTSLEAAASIVGFIGLILLVILAGTVVGGEYGVGTIRVLFTRGPTRTEIFLAKVGVLLICSTLTAFVLILLGVAMGSLFTPLIPGITVDFSFFTAGWIWHALLVFLIADLGLFIYTMLALFFATVGKATAAGVAGALVWWVFETIASSALNIFAGLNNGVVSDFLKSIPTYFIGSNVDALLANQGKYLAGGQASSVSPISDLHALLVLAVYLAVFIGVAWWVNRVRDVTN